MEKNNKDGKTFYLRIRPELLELASSCQEVSVLIVMLGHSDNGNGVCFASLSTLAREAKIRKKTVAAAIETTGVFEAVGERAVQGGYVKEWKVKKKFKHLLVHRPRNYKKLYLKRFRIKSEDFEANADPKDIQKQLNKETSIYIINKKEKEKNSQAQVVKPVTTEAHIGTFKPNKVEESREPQTNSCSPLSYPNPQQQNSLTINSWEEYRKEIINKSRKAVLNMTPEQRGALRRRDKIIKYYADQRKN